MSEVDKRMLSFQKVLASAVLLPALAFSAVAAAAVPAAADDQSQPVPSYAIPGDTSIRGTIRSVDDAYHITVRDAKGYVDNVTLHDGTVINPRGLRLSPGQSVTILGRPNGNTFDANEIDTPYQRYGYAYPVYPYAAYPYPYGYYPAFGFGFRTRGFGFGAVI
jgi:hypothetical protein